MKAREAPEPPVLLEARGLDIGFKGVSGRRILEGVNLSLPSGRLVCLIGPNGSGKSSLLNTLGGLSEPLGGRIMVAGRDLARLSARERARLVSLVLPESPRPAWMRGRELVGLGRQPHTGFSGRLGPEDRRAVDEAIQLAGAGDLAERTFAELSDGERQRLLMARAIAQDCPILIMDEPTMYLDAPARVQALRLLKRLCRQRGRACVVALHEVDLALDWADELWIAQSRDRRLVRGLPEELALRGDIGAAYGQAPQDLLRARKGMAPMEALFPPLRDDATRGSAALSGDGPAAFWTRRLLLRLGFSLDAPDARLRIDLVESAESPAWRLSGPGATGSAAREGSGLASLARALAELGDGLADTSAFSLTS